MSVQSEIYNRLVAAAAVGALAGERVWPHIADQNSTFPYVTYGMVSALPTNSLDGYSNLVRERAQVDVWSTDYAQAIALATAVRDAVIGSNSTVFKAVWADKRDSFEAEDSIYNVQQDFLIWFAE